jgi:hypothetical protein
MCTSGISLAPSSLCYASAVLKLLTAPETNDRGPRYMERALAAIHQANHRREPITLLYAGTGVAPYEGTLTVDFFPSGWRRGIRGEGGGRIGVEAAWFGSHP